MKDKAFFYKKVRDLAQELGEPGIMPTTYKLSEHLGVSALARIAEYGGIKSVAKDIGLELRTWQDQC